MKQDFYANSLRVAVLPCSPDRLLVQQNNGAIVNMSVQSFVSLMVDTFRRTHVVKNQ